MKATPFRHELLEAAVAKFDSDALAVVRAQAIVRFRNFGFPTVRDEDWRYTDLRPAAELGNQWLESFAGTRELPHPQISAPIRSAVDAHWITFRDGVIDRASLEQAQSGIVETSLAQLSEADSPVHLYTEDALSSLNAALLSDGLSIRVAEGATLDKPIGLLHVTTEDALCPMSQNRVQIHVGENARAEFVEAHSSADDSPHFSNGVTEIHLESGATVRFSRVQDLGNKHVRVGRLTARLGQDSRLEHECVDVGGQLVRNDVDLVLTGSGATATTSGLYLAQGEQHIDMHICADHQVGPSVSRQNYRAIAAGRARCVFNGKALVREGADGTDAEQANHNLLLSERAEIDTKPELEIYAEDVKCAHGATVGQLDEAALFYLRTRGLSHDRAAQILTRAFAGQIVAAIGRPDLRDFAEKMVDVKLDSLVEETGQ